MLSKPMLKMLLAKHEVLADSALAKLDGEERKKQLKIIDELRQKINNGCV